MHPSIIFKGTHLGHIQVSSSDFGCPLCPKFRTRLMLVLATHLKNHMIQAVHHQGTTMCRCNMPCRVGGHFHCPICQKTIRHKLDMTAHVVRCLESSEMLRASATSGPPSPQSRTPERCDAFSIGVEHCYPLQATGQTPESVKSPPVQVVSSAAKAAKVGKVRALRVPCPHCAVILNRKNLIIHIKRKHKGPKDITAECHLPSVCVDQDNALYVVKKTWRGFSVPVHVQRKIWGERHAVKCEMEDCQRHHQPAQGSGDRHSMCNHVRSIDYCSTTATEEPLRHQVLHDMLEKKVLDEDDVVACKMMQTDAATALVPLCVFVELDDSQSHFCLSVYEPELRKYSSLGRVSVTYNIKMSTWYCPCAKPGTVCPHKCVAKWHLFQTGKNFSSPGASQSGSCSPSAELEETVTTK